MKGTVKVSRDLFRLLTLVCDEVMKQDEGVHRQDWLKQCTTSRESSEKGGPVTLRTDNDWVIAFLVWYLGKPNIASLLPRDLS